MANNLYIIVEEVRENSLSKHKALRTFRFPLVGRLNSASYQALITCTCTCMFVSWTIRRLHVQAKSPTLSLSYYFLLEYVHPTYPTYPR